MSFSNITEINAMNDSQNPFLLADQNVSRYCLGILFILGTIGLTLNTIIFTRQTFRTTSCILYFLALTMANYPIIYFVMPCQFFAEGFDLDPTQYSLSFCKLREYILTVSRSLSAWFIVLASFDRLMSSSHNIHRRQFCHIHIARLMILITIIFDFLFYLHIPILYVNHLPGQECDAPIGIYRIVNDCLYSLCYIIIPSILMLIFGLLTIYNGRRRRIVPAFQSLYIIKRDRSLFLMLIFQFILFVCTTLPHAVGKLYITISLNGHIDYDDFEDFSNDFFINTVQMISLINHSCQFYIFTLSSKLFRQELKRTFQQLRILPRQPTVVGITMHNNQIHFQIKRKIK